MVYLQSIAKNMSSSFITGQHDMMTAEEAKSNFYQDAPPLVSTLGSSKYHIKWKRLADLPATMHNAHIAVQDRKIYFSGGGSPVKDAQYQVYVYDTDNDRWGQLPTPDHYYAVPHIIDGKLTLIGGVLIATNKMTNKVSTFDHTKQSWVSYYPDLLSVRNKPGIVTHIQYVIVAGGIKDDTAVILDDIEVLDWLENSQWKRVAIHLPVPMCALELTAYDNHLFVVGYTNAGLNYDQHVYKLPVALITNSADQLQCASTGWVELAQTTHWGSSLVTGLSSLIVVGGRNATHTTTADVLMYDRPAEKWKKIDSLSFARFRAATTAINDNALIVIGGFTNMSNPDSTSLTAVELGEVEEVATV